MPGAAPRAGGVNARRPRSGGSAATSIDDAEHGALERVIAAREAAGQNQYKIPDKILGVIVSNDQPLCGPDRRASPRPDRLSERGACHDTDRAHIEHVPHAKVAVRMPVVLSTDEVRRVLKELIANQDGSVYSKRC